MERVRVLVVEDTADLRDELVDYLVSQGHEVLGVGSLKAMQEALAHGTWQVLVLDLGLPDGDGVQATAALRHRYGLSLGIVMVTARGHTDQRIDGLRQGADTYLVKPIDPRELSAVIDRLANRLHTGAVPLQAKGSVSWGLLREQHVLRCPQGLLVELTGSEYLIVARLMTSKGQTVSREELQKLYNPGNIGIDDRRLDTLVSRLRAKIRQSVGMDLPIKTYRNLGYSFVE